MDQTATSATDQLIELWGTLDPWSYDRAAVADLQLQALQERFSERRDQLPLLEQRARDEGVDRINSVQDVVPLLFSHTTYKSYPTSFIEKGQWEMMNRWLGALSTHPIDDVDLADVDGIDDWIRALREAGHLVLTSSGTTGHSSLMNQTRGDRALHSRLLAKAPEVIRGAKADNSYVFFRGGPSHGLNMGSEEAMLLADLYGRPGESHFITDADLSTADLDRLARIRKSIIEGTAPASEIAKVELEAAERNAMMEEAIEHWLDRLFDHWGEPIFLYAGHAMMWRILEGGRSRGVADGSLHADSVIRTGGGMKGFRGQDDFYNDLEEFFGVDRTRWVFLYGMSELLTQFIRCIEGNYHFPPTTIPIILDKDGATMLNRPSGIVEGRAGFFDVTLEGRWGGVISGDKLTVDFDACACGREGPAITEVSRYVDLSEGDDKLTCAGQIDSYIRGFVGGDWQA